MDGRRPAPEERKRTRAVFVRLSEAEYEAARRLAERLGVGVATVLRMALRRALAEEGLLKTEEGG